MPDDPPLTTAEALAATYDGPVHPWERVAEYEQVMEYKSHHPNKGSQAIASVLDLPRSRIRPWLDGAAPDVVHGIRAAGEHGWLNLHADDPVFRGLNALVAWIYSGGSINEWYTPFFTIDDATDRDRLERAADRANVALRVSRQDDPGHADELVPTEDAAILGRVLVTLDTPVGNKVTIRRLPSYLDGAPDGLRREFARVYLQNRGVARPDKGIWQIREERPEQYIRTLARFFDDVLDTRIESGANIIRIWDDGLADIEA